MSEIEKKSSVRHIKKQMLGMGTHRVDMFRSWCGKWVLYDQPGQRGHYPPLKVYLEGGVYNGLDPASDEYPANTCDACVERVGAVLVRLSKKAREFAERKLGGQLYASAGEEAP